MTDNQENKLSMYRANEIVLDYYNAKWNAIVPFVSAKTAFSGKIADLLTARQQQIDIITGIAADKKVLKDVLITITDNVASSVMDYATVSNNNQLLNSVSLTHSQLERARDEVVAGLCRNIYTHASDNAAALVPYGVTALVLTDFDTAINAYSAKVPQPRAAASDKKAVTTSIRALIKDIDKIQKLRLDKLMVRFKTTETQFSEAYKTSRFIINLGATHTKLAMLIKDQGGSPLQGAIASLLQNNLVVYSVTSDADGKIALPKITPGTYDLRTEKTNFVTKTEIGIQFKPGKALKRTVTLIPGITIIREADVPPMTIVNIPVIGINGTPLSELLSEISGSPLRFYAAANPTDAPGTDYYDGQIGQAPFNLDNFKVAIGYGPGKQLLNVQNMGAVAAHVKLTFSKLAP